MLLYKALGIGGILFKNSHCLDMLYIGTLDGKISFSIENPALPGGSFSSDFDGACRDYAFTVGKKILNDRAGLYTDYKVGETGGSQPLYQYLTFQEKEFLVSGNYGWLIADADAGAGAGAGALTLNLAYEKLNGLSRKKAITGFEDLGFSIDFEGTGDTEGLSYRANGSSRLTDHVSYSIGLKVGEYTFKNITGPNVSFTDKIEEKLSSITFSTYYSS